MRKSILLSLIALLCAVGTRAEVDKTVSDAAIEEIAAAFPNANRTQIEKGVRQIAGMWNTQDGTEDDFRAFCHANYISNPTDKERIFLKLSDYFEAIYGYFNQMSVRLRWNTMIDTGQLDRIDHWFDAYAPLSHLSDDLFNNKIAFYVALNFPKLSLDEKEALGGNRLTWAYARMGDMFTERIPAEASFGASEAAGSASAYVAGLNIYMGKLRDNSGQQLFPDDMVLLSHWNLRDEIKANYNKREKGLEKQRMIYQVMKRIVAEQVPGVVVDSDRFEWNPYTNAVTSGGEGVMLIAMQEYNRYKHMLATFRAMREIDKHTGNTFIDRKFDGEMEIAVDQAEKLFVTYLSSPELKKAGTMISKRLGRKLEAFDIWYDGFKPRSAIDQTELDRQIQNRYSSAEIFKTHLPDILTQAGFSADRAAYLADKIAVDPARGSGHAWGAEMRGQQSRLRTKVPVQGMDYKGYNIAIHELGHNVEQTISLYDMDYYMLRGVPNTAFTEALAFMFQKRDLEILSGKKQVPDAAAEKANVLDKAWVLYEMCGVSLLDIYTWRWLYANPDATVDQLAGKVLELSKEIWNKYYAPVYGIRDQTILAIYSHLIEYPLYMSSYAFGYIIEFQLEDYMKGKDFATEVDRIYKLGRLTPSEWMKQATGSTISADPLIKALRKAVK